MKATPPPVAPPPPESVPVAPVDPAVPAAPAKRADRAELARGLDVVLVVLAVVVAVLAASFAARNTDLWLSLAGGRLVAQGDFHLAADPFTFPGAERPWVHSAWLGDLLFYALYSLDTSGGVLAGFKALAFAAAFAVPLLLRRAGAGLAPWGLFALLGAVAAAPYALLRTSTLSLPFLAVVLVLVSRRMKANSWRGPAELGLVTLLWANVDAWAWLGPVAVLCVLVGELVDRKWLRAGPDPAAPPDADADAAPTGALARALILAVVACLLNPYLIAALVKDPSAALAQLVPAEFGVGLPAGAAEDRQLAGLTIGPFHPDVTSLAVQPTAIVSLAGLALGAAAGVAAAVARLRAASVLLLVAFAAVGIQNVRTVPFFAVVAAPVAAALWNVAAARERKLSESAERVLTTAAGTGRVAAVAAAFGLAVLSYPGRLHPRAADPANARRVEWAVVADPGLERSARLLASLAAGDKTPGGRGLNTGVDLGDYAAFFAPGERTFVNSRPAFHRPEFPDLLAVRRGLALISTRPPDGQQDDFRAGVAALDARRATHLIVTGAGGSARQVDPQGALVLTTGESAAWGLVHLDGRLAVAARGPSPSALFDPVRLAFGPDTRPAKAGLVVLPPPRDLGFAGEFVTRPAPLPPEADDAAVILQYDRWTANLSAVRYEVAFRLAPGAVGGGPVTFGELPPPPLTEVNFAAPVLAVRAAREAILLAPDRPEGYLRLAEAYDPGTVRVMPALDGPAGSVVALPESVVQRLAALTRYLDRVPPPGAGSPGEGVEAFLAAFALAEALAQTRQFDAAKQTLDRADEYLAALPPPQRNAVAYRLSGGQAESPAKAAEQFRKEIDRRLDLLRAEVQRAEQAAALAPTPQAKFAAFAQRGMPLAALAVLAANPAPGPGDPKGDPLGATRAELEVGAVRLNLQAGRLDAAWQYLTEPSAAMTAELAKPDSGPAAVLLAANGLAARLAGDYPAAQRAIRPDPAPPVFPGYDPARHPLNTLFPLSLVAGGTIHAFIPRQELPPAGPDTPLGKQIERFQQQGRSLILESRRSHDRALLALLEGRIPEAKAEFEAAAAPQKVRIGMLNDLNRAAQIASYLALIDRTNR